ncbi:DUF1361 domain-containing protein [Agrilactobacillus yilanensis]|uniref:DUF1361 domain-containing protein n=1 Tax=Agrilactobacillus yilanensis TaxID=2485997 RepID=A0ABW4J869_9LACO|nr:DUF1361 domain-containing protein [Agrilactobacillus yilanensis]
MQKKQLQWLIRLVYILFLIYAFFFIQDPYDFIFLNTLLAYIPIELAFHLTANRPKHNIFFWLIFIVWLLFYPNNPYLLTDLFHLTLLHPYNPATMLIKTDIHIWLYFAYLVGTAIVTTIIGLATFENVVQALTQRFFKNNILVHTFIFELLLFLTSIGIYIGRFLRIHTVYLLDPQAIIQPLLKMWHLQSIQFFLIIFGLLNLIYLSIWIFRQLLHKNEL